MQEKRLDGKEIWLPQQLAKRMDKEHAPARASQVFAIEAIISLDREHLDLRIEGIFLKESRVEGVEPGLHASCGLVAAR